VVGTRKKMRHASPRSLARWAVDRDRHRSTAPAPPPGDRAETRPSSPHALRTQSGSLMRTVMSPSGERETHAMVVVVGVDGRRHEPFRRVHGQAVASPDLRAELRELRRHRRDAIGPHAPWRCWSTSSDPREQRQRRASSPHREWRCNHRDAFEGSPADASSQSSPRRIRPMRSSASANSTSPRLHRPTP
jgi:hypothetical protein